MKDLFLKLKILIYYLHDAYIQWDDEIWRNDLDDRFCCDGRECGCDGATIRDMYTKHN